MTLATSPYTPHPDPIPQSFEFAVAELTSHLRQASSSTLTGYWTIRFQEGDGQDPTNWYLCLLKGKIVFSCNCVPQSQDYIDVLRRYIAEFRKGDIRRKLQSFCSEQSLEKAKQLREFVHLWTTSGIVQPQDIVQAIRIHLLNDLDRFLAYPKKGMAHFTPAPELAEVSLMAGFQVNELFLESIKRRVEWAGLQAYIPGLDAVLTLTPKALNLKDYQRTTLEDFIQEGRTLMEVSRLMGKDTLAVAKSFSHLVQQGIIAVDHQDLEAPPLSPPDHQSAPQICIVDDSPVLIRQFTTLLEHWGYVVQASQESVNAVKKICDCQPQVIFLDVNMPEVSGFELIKQIRREPSLANIPLVMLTAEKSVSNQWRAQWASCKFLSKPSSASEVDQFRQDLKGLLRELAPLPSDVLV